LETLFAIIDRWKMIPPSIYPSSSHHFICVLYLFLSLSLFYPYLYIYTRRIPQIANLLWIQAFNKRLGTSGLRTADLYYKAASSSSSSSSSSSAYLPTVVEEDGWQYQTLRYGKPDVGRSMVCCVLACSLYKAGGLMEGYDMNCGEVTNYDIASMAIYDDTKGYTQILGEYVLTINDFNSRPLYNHYAENCPDQPPYFVRPQGC